MVVRVCNPSTWVTEAGGSQVQGQPGVHNETLSQTKQNQNTNKQNPKENPNKNNKKLSKKTNNSVTKLAKF
jgi:hypothetical protein